MYLSTYLLFCVWKNLTLTLLDAQEHEKSEKKVIVSARIRTHDRSGIKYYCSPRALLAAGGFFNKNV
jgi:hypothetical protein